MDSEPSEYKLNQVGTPIEEDFDYTKDTDNDGLPDFFEKVLGTNPNKVDTDDDDLSDAYEYLVLRTDPLKQDTDNNGINDSSEDFDKDGLNNLEEYRLGTDPYKIDTDLDGLIDKEEVETYKTNPLVYDTDEDGIGDGVEIKLGLDPLTKYTHDGILDSKYKVEQIVTEDQLNLINTPDNPYSLSLQTWAAGDVGEYILADTSAYEEVMGDNRAILGKVVDLEYDLEQVQNTTLRFKIEASYTKDESAIDLDNEELMGIKRYNVFKYFEDEKMLLPIKTYHDTSNNMVYADVNELGTYCIMDLQKWLYDLGVTENTINSQIPIANLQDSIEQYNIVQSNTQVTSQGSIQPSNSNKLNIADTISKDYEPITLEELYKALDVQDNHIMKVNTNSSTNVNQPVDITFVVDTTGSMGNAINNVKVNMGNLITTLYSEGITPYISVVNYSDYINQGSAGAFVVKKSDGGTWAYNKNEAIELISKLNLGYGADETPIDGLEMARRLNFRSSATKFVVLVTDEDYYIDNRYGIKSIYEMADLLNKDKKITTVVTSNYLKSTYEPLFKNTDGAWFDIYSNFSPQLRDFILTRIQGNNKFSVVTSVGMHTITLEEPLAKGGSTDTDKDTLTDSDEVNWDLITIGNGQVKLPTLEECMNRNQGYSTDAIDRLGESYTNAIKNIQVLPIKSDPTKIDSDGDGILDKDDEDPLNSNVLRTWYKISFGNEIMYINQGKEGANCQEARVCEVGDTQAEIYTFDGYDWNPTGQFAAIPGEDTPLPYMVNQEGDSYRLYSSKALDLPSFNKVKERVIDFTANLADIPGEMEKYVKDTISKYGYDIDNMTKEDWEMVILGASAGYIDCSFPATDVKIGITLEPFLTYEVEFFTIPSSSKVKALLFKTLNKKESELEQNLYYIQGKRDMEFLIFVGATIGAAGSITAATALFNSAGITITTGGVAIASGVGAPVGAAIEVVGATQLMASGVCAIAGLKFAEVAGNAKGHFDEDSAKFQNMVKGSTKKYIPKTGKWQAVGKKLAQWQNELRLKGYSFGKPYNKGANSKHSFNIINEKGVKIGRVDRNWQVDGKYVPDHYHLDVDGDNVHYWFDDPK